MYGNMQRKCICKNANWKNAKAPQTCISQLCWLYPSRASAINTHWLMCKSMHTCTLLLLGKSHWVANILEFGLGDTKIKFCQGSFVCIGGNGTLPRFLLWIPTDLLESDQSNDNSTWLLLTANLIKATTISLLDSTLLLPLPSPSELLATTTMTTTNWIRARLQRRSQLLIGTRR